MSSLRSVRDAFLKKLETLDSEGKIEWNCNRNTSTISGKIGEKTISISEESSGMGLKNYHIEITKNDGVILDKFSPNSAILLFSDPDEYDEEQDHRLFGLDSHKTDTDVRNIFQKSMTNFSKEI